MIKISTLFKKDPNNLGRVINEVDPEEEQGEDYEDQLYVLWFTESGRIIGSADHTRYNNLKWYQKTWCWLTRTRYKYIDCKPLKCKIEKI